RNHGRLPAGRLIGFQGYPSSLDWRLRGVEARINVTRAPALLPVAMLALVSACNRAGQTEDEGNQPVTVDVPRAAAEQPGVTPMAQRVAVLGLLNTRNGIVRDLTLRPGHATRV